MSMPGKVKYPTSQALEMCNLSWTPHSSVEKDNSQGRHGSVVVSMACRWSVVRIPGPSMFHYYFRYKNLALNIRDCLSLCLLEETLKAVGPF